VDPRDAGPIYSLLSDDESLLRLDAFVIALGESIDMIQDADRLGEWAEVGERAFTLAKEAAAHGLPPLAEAATRLATSCTHGDPARAHAEVVELTELASRVRLGHRGRMY
jgi:hypothetical protein